MWDSGFSWYWPWKLHSSGMWLLDIGTCVQFLHEDGSSRFFRILRIVSVAVNFQQHDLHKHWTKSLLCNAAATGNLYPILQSSSPQSGHRAYGAAPTPCDTTAIRRCVRSLLENILYECKRDTVFSMVSMAMGTADLQVVDTGHLNSSLWCFYIFWW